MKKLLLFALSILIVLSLIVSCDNSQKIVEGEVVVLDFLGEGLTRGITEFPSDIPFYSMDDGKTVLQAEGKYYNGTTYGFWMSCNVMRSLPIFPGLKSVNADANAYIKSIKNKHLKGYGFDLSVKIAEMTDDGVFISYDIESNNSTTGTIEYYYSIKDKKFSYREIVMPLLGKTGGDQIFVFEMLNVPVSKEGNDFSFKAGELYNNGSTFTHVTFVNGNYDTEHGGADEKKIMTLFFEDAKIAMNYNGNTVYSTEYQNYHLDNDTISLMELIGKESISLNADNRKTYNMTHILDFLRAIYEDTFEKHGFSTIDDFNDTKLKIREEKKGVLYKDDNTRKTFFGLGFPLSFNLKEKIGACIYYSNANVEEKNWKDQFTDISIKNFKKCLGKDFSDFDQFVCLFLDKLGLTEEQIKNRKTLLKDSYNIQEHE